RERQELATGASAWLQRTNAKPDAINPMLLDIGSTPITEPTRLATILRRPGVSVDRLLAAPGVDVPEELRAEAATEVFTALEMEVRYDGYLARERERAEAMRRHAEFLLPEDLDYAFLQSISTEARQKLDRIRPRTIGQAGRIPGISPSDLQNLVMEVRKRSR